MDKLVTIRQKMGYMSFVELKGLFKDDYKPKTVKIPPRKEKKQLVESILRRNSEEKVIEKVDNFLRK